jgi:opine dehydrogenase
VPLAAFLSARTQQVQDALVPSYPKFIDGGNVLHTGLNNMGAIFPPALTLLNAGRIESTGGDFQFYLDGATPSVAKMLEELDRERVIVAAALGIRAHTAQDWLKITYNAAGANPCEAIHNLPS